MVTNPIMKYRDILSYLQKHGAAKVSDLSRDLFLSESTIRRALVALESEGKLRRYHGGAVTTDPAAHSPIQKRQVSYWHEKNAIGKMASTFVREGMTLLLMGGTTVQAICPHIKGMRLTVITCSLPVMNELAWEEQMKVILLGGVLNPAEMEVRGGFTHIMLEHLRADLMFMGTTGLHPVHGLMTDDPNGVESYTTCMHISDQVIVLADHTKCENYWGTTILCGLSDITYLITDTDMQASTRAYYETRMNKIYFASQ